MTSGTRRRGPVWRARRRWASMGLLARIVSVALGLLILFIVLGAVLEACGASDEEPQQPATSSTSSGTLSPLPDLPRATAETEVPAQPSVTVTKTVTATRTATEEASEPSSSAPEAGVYYENCDEARAAGAAPLTAGDPGYRPELDRDGDGVACEP